MITTALSTNCTTRDEWLAERRRGIGASDAAAIIGVSTFKSAFAVWAEKTGQINDTEDETELQEWGRLLEPIVRERFERSTGLQVHYEGPYVIHQHTECPWVLCTLDGLIDPTAVYEGKTANRFVSHKWDEGPPLYVEVQAQQQLAVTGREVDYVSCLLGACKQKHWEIPRNDRFIDNALLPRLEKFWRCVENREPPPVDGSDSTAEALKLLYPDGNGETVLLAEEFVKIGRRLDRVIRAKATLYDSEQELKNQFRAAIGEATFGVLSDGTTYSLKQQTRAAHRVKESTFRVLRKCK